jgi:hypothetical protein
MNIETGVVEYLSFGKHHAPPLSQLIALSTVNEWNRIAGLTNVSKWRYWV